MTAESIGPPSTAMRTQWAAALLVLIAAGLTACSSSAGSSQASPPSSTAPSALPAIGSSCPTCAASPSQTVSPLATTAGSEPPVDAAPTSGTFEIESSAGIRVSATLDLHAPAPTSDARSVWGSEGGSGDIPCVTDPQTDAVIVGTLKFDNETPNYTPDFYVNFNGITAGGALALGAGYTGGNQCVTDGSDAYEGSAIQPTWKGSSWGPLPIVIVIHHDIGPNYQKGNPANLGPIELVVNSQSGGDYELTREGGIISQLNGPVMQVHLENLTH